MKKTALLLLGVCLLAALFMFRHRLADWLNRLSPAAANTVSAESVVLQADDHDSRDEAWEKRYYYGKRSWGIRGSGRPEAGEMRFQSFPGETGTYRITLGAIFEADGSPHYRVAADGQTLGEGQLPYHGGSRNCDARGAPEELDLGKHRIEHGQTISIWAKAVYECGEKGAYMLWHQLRFERQPG